LSADAVRDVERRGEHVARERAREGRVELERLAHERGLREGAVDEEPVAVDVLVEHENVGVRRRDAGLAAPSRAARVEPPAAPAAAAARSGAPPPPGPPAYAPAAPGPAAAPGSGPRPAARRPAAAAAGGRVVAARRPAAIF